MVEMEMNREESDARGSDALHQSRPFFPFSPTLTLCDGCDAPHLHAGLLVTLDRSDRCSERQRIGKVLRRTS